MLGKTSVSMMVLLVAASLIGISSIHQYVEGQGPPRVVGNLIQVTSYVSVAGCVVSVQLSTNVPNPLGLDPGTPIMLFSDRVLVFYSVCRKWADLT